MCFEADGRMRGFLDTDPADLISFDKKLDVRKWVLDHYTCLGPPKLFADIMKDIQLSNLNSEKITTGLPHPKVVVAVYEKVQAIADTATPIPDELISEFNLKGVFIYYPKDSETVFERGCDHNKFTLKIDEDKSIGANVSASIIDLDFRGLVKQFNDKVGECGFTLFELKSINLRNNPLNLRYDTLNRFLNGGISYDVTGLSGNGAGSRVHVGQEAGTVA
ncbi:UNVERIFIED_CONTAM: hypothetical protein HDU68_005153 [Siphonaria sp. JEL0065]|nr:hypothetical protein HDU68_005153 [Siphonaria sp. JEL0065]